MYVHMYVHVYVCMYICMYVCTYGGGASTATTITHAARPARVRVLMRPSAADAALGVQPPVGRLRTRGADVGAVE